MTKYPENLLRDSPLSLLFIVKFFSSLESKTVLKIPNETFLRITLYIQNERRETLVDASWVKKEMIVILARRSCFAQTIT